ncbi:MAG: hypothetical protein ABIG44_18315 [Planctomycetota bacterium]
MELSSRLTSPGRSVLLVLGVTVSILVLPTGTPVAWAHRGHGFGSPFHSVSLAQAGRLAEDEGKLVYIYVTEPRGRPPKYLAKPTMRDWRGIDLLILETVAIRLDAGFDADQLTAYKLDQLPVMLLLAPDGTEQIRLSGDLNADQLATQLAAAISDEDTLARIRKLVAAGGDNDPLARERLAQALVRREQYADALREYVWCLDVGLRVHIPYASARRTLVFKGVAQLTERYTHARQALETWRTTTENSLLHEHNANLARDLAELNSAWNDENRTLAFHDRLPPKSRARQVLFDYVFELLIAAGRYQEVLAVADPLRTFKQEIRMVRMQGSPTADDIEESPRRGTRSFALNRGAALVEALAGTDQNAEACALAKEILKFDHTPRTHALLRRHAERARSQSLIEFLASCTSQPAKDKNP